MAAQRKIFRIEKMTAPRFEPRSDEAQAPRRAEIMQELSALRAMLAATPAAPIVQASAPRQDQIQRLMSEPPPHPIRHWGRATDAVRRARTGDRTGRTHRRRIGNGDR